MHPLISRWLKLRDANKAFLDIMESADAKVSLQEQILWLSGLVSWLRGPTISVPEEGAAARASMARLRYLTNALQRNSQWREVLSLIIARILTETNATNTFAQTALTEQSGFFSEVSRRVTRKIFPLVPRPNDLTYALEVVFSGGDDDVFLEAISEEDWDRLLDLFQWSEDSKFQIVNSLNHSLDEAVLNLSVQIAAIALSAEVSSRMTSKVGTRSCFNRLIIGVAEKESPYSLRHSLAECRFELDQAYEGIETSGVSLALLYRLETLSGLIARLSLILNLRSEDISFFERQHYARSYLIGLVSTLKHRRSLSPLMKMNFDIFARKLVEHAGETGEHYITRNRREYWTMLRSGAAGGLWMVPATFLKFIFTMAHLPPIIEGLAIGINYSSTFLAMQFSGATLATKQPSMTAAALAEKLSSTMSRERLEEFVDEVVRITRSQFIAAIGNVGFVIPPALLISYLYLVLFNEALLDEEYARHVIKSLHPLKSLALWYASIAGVLLWFSSLCAGWLQNLVIYRELPEAIARHRRLNELLGPERCRRFGQWVLKSASGIGGNISIGFLLAFAPIIGANLGLPIDIRHVTISAAQQSVALVSLGIDQVSWQMVLSALISVTLIGIFNFGVSTALALFVALRAKRVRTVWVKALIIAVGVRFRRQPWTFFLPFHLPEHNDNSDSKPSDQNRP